MKKLTALLLVLAVSAGVFSACREEEYYIEQEDEAIVLESDEADIKEEVESSVLDFMKLYFAMNEEAFEYMDEDSSAYDEFDGTLDGEQVLGDALVGRHLPENYEDSKELIADTFFNKYADYVDLKIDNVKINGSEATVNCTATIPDIDRIENIVTEEFVLETLEDNFTDKEIVEIYSGKAFDSLELSFKLIRVLCEEILEEMKGKTVEQKFVLTLEEKNGNWKITEFEIEE